MRHFVAVGGSSLWFRASLSRGGGFCPPRAITRGQVVIGTPHWRNKRGAAYTSFVLLFFRRKFLPFCAQEAPKTRRFFPRARPRRKQSRNTARGRCTAQNKIPEFGPARWTAQKPRLAPFNRRAACPSAVRSQITPIRGRSDLKMRLKCDIISLRLGLVCRAISVLALCQLKNKRVAAHTSLISMCSRGLRIFFRTRNQVSNRKNRYRLTAINFEAALYSDLQKLLQSPFSFAEESDFQFASVRSAEAGRTARAERQVRLG